MFASFGRENVTALFIKCFFSKDIFGRFGCCTAWSADHIQPLVIINIKFLKFNQQNCAAPLEGY